MKYLLALLFLLTTSLTTFSQNNIDSLLIEAVFSNNIEQVSDLIDKGADVNSVQSDYRYDYYGYSVLHYASSNKNGLDIARLLIEKGADVNYLCDDYDYKGYTALSFAIDKEGNYELAKLLLENKADPNKQVVSETSYTNGWAPLHFAVLKENAVDLVKLLLRHGANPNLIAGDSRVPLSLAAYSKKGLELAEVLVRAGAKINVTCTENETPLYKACYNGSFEMARYLIEKGADVNIASTGEYTIGKTALHAVARKPGAGAVIKLLVKKGANINALDDDGWSPLHEAVMTAHDNIIPLLELGADPTGVRTLWDESRQPMLFFAIEQKCSETQLIALIDAIVAYDADVYNNWNDGYGNTGLHYVMEQELTLPVLRKLIKVNGGVDTENNLQQTPVFKANNTEKILMLVDLGAKLNLVDSYGKTPIDYYIESGSVDLSALTEYIGPFDLLNNGFEEALIEQINQGAVDVNTKDARGNTLLHLGIANNRQQLVDALIQDEQLINIPDSLRRTPLLLSLVVNDTATALKLIEKGADGTLADANGFTPLYICQQKGFSKLENRLAAISTYQTPLLRVDVANLKDYDIYNGNLEMDEDLGLFALWTHEHIYIGDLETGNIVHSIAPPSNYYYYAAYFSEENRTLRYIQAGNNKAELLDCDVLTGYSFLKDVSINKNVIQANISEHKIFLVTTDSVYVTDADAFNVNSKYNYYNYSYYDPFVFSESGNRLVNIDPSTSLGYSYGDYDEVGIFDANTGEKVSTISHSRAFYSCLSPNDSLLLVLGGSNYKVSIYNVSSGELVSAFNLDELGVRKKLSEYELKLMEQEDYEYYSTDNFNWAVFTPDNQSLIVPAGTQVVKIGLEDKAVEVIATYANYPSEVVFGKQKSVVLESLVCPSYEYLVVYDETTGEEQMLLIEPDIGGSAVTCTKKQANGQQWTLEVDKREEHFSLPVNTELQQHYTDLNFPVQVPSDIEEGGVVYKELFFEGHTGNILSMDYNAESTLLISGSEDCTIGMYTGSSDLIKIIKGHSAAVNYVKFIGNDKFISCSSDKTVRVWDTGGNVLKSFHHENPVGWAKLSPDKKRLLTYDNQIVFSLWDFESETLLAEIHKTDSLNWAVTTPSGLFDATPQAMKQMYFVQGLEVIELAQLKERFYEPGLLKKILNHESLRNVEAFNNVRLYPEIKLSEIVDGGLNIDLTNNGGGIGRVVVSINGKEIEQDARGAGLDENAETASIEKSIKDHPYLLADTNNVIEVKAYNAEGWLISRGATVLYNPGVSAEPEIPELYIVSIGVSDYTGDQIDLKYAAKDASDISKALRVGAKRLFGADKVNTYLLTAAQASDTASVRNSIAHPTKENIEKTFDEIAQTAKANDIIVVYLSGHGINHGGDNGDFYYLTADAYTANIEAYNDSEIRNTTTLSSTELTELIKLIPALKQVLIIDACASGKVVENLMAQRDISSSTIRVLDRMKDRTGMHIITGSAADAVSYEAGKYGQGVLTYSLIDGIRGAALRDEKYVDVNTLFQYSKETVPVLARGIGGIQQPQVFSPYGAQSFDIGSLTDDDKAMINLAKVKPVFIRSNFLDMEEMTDELSLGNQVDEMLNEASQKSVDSKLIFVDVREYPEAYKLSGIYTQSSEGIQLNLTIKSKEQKIKRHIEADTVELLLESLQAEVDKLVQEL